MTLRMIERCGESATVRPARHDTLVMANGAIPIVRVNEVLVAQRTRMHVRVDVNWTRVRDHGDVSTQQFRPGFGPVAWCVGVK